ncbi:MAG: 3-deoxy-D-manno-octulosonic acid transferase [Bacteroidetes bacterium]|nr:MAG: 3-deoxy-D-manno-octulosonic acid transferase [Bacteroidota bacterium]
MVLKAAIFLYQLTLLFYKGLLQLAALFGHAKALEFFAGRQRTWKSLVQFASTNQKPVVWLHSASVGEFEQGKPVLEALKQQYPQHAFCVSFFSPSGYEAKKTYDAQWVGYLPLDSAHNAQLFLQQVRPSLAIFVKYEYWWFYLRQLQQQQIPTLLVAGSFRPEQPFFKWYGLLHKKMLGCFTHVFVQTQAMEQLLHSIDVQNITTCGDPRFDRVLQVATQPKVNEHVEHFMQAHSGKPVLVAGSTWPADDAVLAPFANTHSWACIIAPHNVDEASILACKKMFPSSQLLSQYQPNADSNVLIIDCIGLLSSLYQYATLTYVGGGFSNDGVHNVLEAAVYGKPVLCGPNIKKYWEAKALVEQGGLFTVATTQELQQQINLLQNSQISYQAACQASAVFVRQHSGATDAIVKFIYEKRLLTKSSK